MQIENTFRQPRLSVVVPVYNSLRDLQQCLPSLASSGYDNFDVLVVDDGSTEPIESLVREHGFEYMRIDGPGGPARARNRGVEKAQCEIVVFVDADVCVHEDTLLRFAERFAADRELSGVIGSYDEEPADRSFISQYKNLFHHYVHQSCDGKINTFWTGCGAMRRDLFLQFGGFDEIRYRRPAIEDIELGTWVSAAGYKIVLDNSIKAKHLKRWTLRNLLKTDIFDRGIPWTRLMLRAGTVANTLNVKPVQRISVALVYLTVLLLGASIMWRPLVIVATAFAVAVTVLNLDFYRFFAAHRGWLFTLCVVPLHWLYFGYCGFSVLCGTLQHYLDRTSTSSRQPLPMRTDVHAE